MQGASDDYSILETPQFMLMLLLDIVQGLQYILIYNIMIFIIGLCAGIIYGWMGVVHS